MYECEFTFDRDFFRRALRRDHFWWSLYSVLAFAGLLLLIGAVWGFAALVHPSTLRVIAIGTLAILLVRYVVYRLAIKQTFALFEQQSPSRRIRFVAHDDELEVIVDQGTQRYRWEKLRRLWRYHDVWLFEIIKNRSMLLDPNAASDEMKNFIVARCEAAGLKT